jgi:large subunit ribosomal protein L35
MPKMKTHKGAAKRFRATAGGRLKRNQPGHRHILTSKSRKRKRQMRLPDYISPAEEKAIKRLLPYL